MKNEEQLYTIPLGKAYDYKRTKRTIRAVKLVREFVLRHAKAEEVIISMKVNELLWSRSIQKPPRKIKVKVVKKENRANVYLPEEKIEEEKKEEKVEKKKTESEKEGKAAEKVEKKEEEKEKKGETEKTVKKETKKEEKPNEKNSVPGK